MTALAIAVHPRRAVLAADSLGCDPHTGAPLGHVSKIACLPHLRAVAAWCGYSRLGRAFDLIPPAPAGATVEDVIGYLQPLLLMLADAAARKQPPMPGAGVFLAGAVTWGGEAEVRAFALRLAEGFEPLKLEPGRCYVLGDIPPEPVEQDVAAAELTLPTGGKREPPRAPLELPWPELARMPTKIVELLRQERAASCGGPVQSVLLTTESAFYSWDDRDP